MIRRVFVEKRPGFDTEAGQMMEDLRESLGLSALAGLRLINRYDVEDLAEADYKRALAGVFAEPQSDFIFEEKFPIHKGENVFAIEYLPGQFDQRADSAAQCVQILTKGQLPRIACARVIVLKGALSAADIAKVKAYLINAVDSREASLDKPETLETLVNEPPQVPLIDGFINKNGDELEALRKKMGLAMSHDDIVFCQKYFNDEEKRDPTVTEIRVLDTYWSDHCRHTTFLTRLEDVTIDDGRYTDAIKAAWKNYQGIRARLYVEKDKPVTLMDVATIGAKELKKRGLLNDIEESEEINAASIVVMVDVDGKDEEWLVMFKNETHNHPTEIEPFGGAATCLGGAIRDPLSGRSYVYQAMRVTGAADPRKPLSETLPGKLPQKKIVREAARGYSSYGNQIGLATGMVHEVYHPRYEAKRMEIGAVIGAAPRGNVFRGTPKSGDLVILTGGRTGRDGIGGATGSSKEHDQNALKNSAEVQKGDAPQERKLQRLFRRSDAAKMIVRCNDFGAGGVSVAIGELAPGLHIHLDKVPRKYEGLDGTELAISESQERMAVVLKKRDVEKFMRFIAEENLEGTIVAEVTDDNRLVMDWRGQFVVDVSRAFLDTAGAPQTTTARILAPSENDSPVLKPSVPATMPAAERWAANLADLNRSSQRGLIERFDSTIGAGSVVHPFGGSQLATQPETMIAKIPLLKGETTTGTMMAYGFDPYISTWSPFHGATYAVVESLARIAASGGDTSKCRLTFQEYFPKTGSDVARWGLPLSALLGALNAQLAFGTAAIGGKDSMSGSFKNLDVPPTLVSFAVCALNLRDVITPEFKKPGSTVALLRVPIGKDLLPNLDEAKKLWNALHEAIKEGDILAAHSVRSGGVAEALSKMALGNNLGFTAAKEIDDAYFMPFYGSIVVELAQASALPEAMRIGATSADESIVIGKTHINLERLRNAWETPLESVFPTNAVPHDATLLKVPEPHVAPHVRKAAPVAKPRVFIPVFPGTNCEYDSARAFEEAGAIADVFVLRNISAKEVDQSLLEMARRIANAQILMMPGGFSAGDEPDGSGKFAAAVLRNSEITNAVMNLITKRDGLVLGVCNGFQVLIKLGLIQYGDIRTLQPGDATLTFNTIGRHQSRYIRTKVASNLSPWLALTPVGSTHCIPISHGEGRIAASRETLAELISKGQVATQYADPHGNPTMDIQYNPNGSLSAIEGLTSPCGRVFGKMAHSERKGHFVGLNVPGEKNQPIFEAGVKYFR
jgi:phosphoribosylformylglycinamidine synthase